MAKHRNDNKKKKKMKKRSGGMVKLKIAVEKLQRSLLLGVGGRKSSSDSCDVPEDVKEGHFAVIAEDGETPKRFVVPLRCLTHPTFLRLLEQAAEEYGFDQEGAITIPCRPSELETILADQQWQEDDTDSSDHSHSDSETWS